VSVVELDHESILEQLSDYLDSSLSDADRARVEEHLARCRFCRAVLATLQATREAVSLLPHERAPESAKRRLFRIPEA
jgi:anti-sigma factor RsiW